MAPVFSTAAFSTSAVFYCISTLAFSAPPSRRHREAKKMSLSFRHNCGVCYVKRLWYQYYYYLLTVQGMTLPEYDLCRPGELLSVSARLRDAHRKNHTSYIKAAFDNNIVQLSALIQTCSNLHQCLPVSSLHVYSSKSLCRLTKATY